jgi:hypothetical protein
MSNIQEVNMFAVTPAIEQEWEQQAQNIKETRTKEEAVEYLEYERTVARVQRAFLLSDGYVTGTGAISSECYEKYINYLTALIQSKETWQEKSSTASTIVAPYIKHLIEAGMIDNEQNKKSLVSSLSVIAQDIKANGKGVEITGALLGQFKKRNGKPYSSRQIQRALNTIR